MWEALITKYLGYHLVPAIWVKLYVTARNNNHPLNSTVAFVVNLYESRGDTPPLDLEEEIWAPQ